MAGHEDRLPPGTPRVFGRIDRFTCECPRCGQLIHVHLDRPGQLRRSLSYKDPRDPPGAPKRPKTGGKFLMMYNPLTSRLTCPQCQRVFGVGLLLYPVAPRAAPSQPRDQRATWAQMLAIRQLAGGFFMDKATPITGDDSLNIAIDHECTCWLEDSQPPRMHYVQNCPIHGWLDQPGAEEVVEVKETVDLIKDEPDQ